ncbi:MAG: polyphosphate polymerase domain-containing protein [Gammaproteobacteria bacterium]|nr:polyphosphate polymerase domain-containing protein [Gammaproteobacteria bacterium]
MQTLLKDFKSVSLDETNRLAKMLSRAENKYVVNFKQYSALLAAVREDYAVLDIYGRNEFQYASCYYDDNFACYNEHHQSRRHRFKVRTRKYVNSGLMFFEVKLKGLRGRTDKHRMGCDSFVMPEIEGEHLRMLNELHSKNYRKEMHFDLTPSLIVNYSRCTLVALNGGERVTIDFDLGFKLPEGESDAVQIGHNFIIIETKSADGRGKADSALKKMGVRKASKCSKYCIGVNLTGEGHKNNNFLHTVKRARNNIVLVCSAAMEAAQ